MSRPSDRVPTAPELLAWLRERPRTYEWDALLAYDRTRANRLLMQEYIARFNSERYLPPVTQLHEHAEGTHWEYIYEYLLTSPRLSFEDSSIANSKANLTMHVMGGMQLTIEKPQHQVRRITKVEVIDALQGPKLMGKVHLSDVEGGVTTSGKVEINLRDALDLELTNADTPTMRNLGGKYFQHLFDNLPPEKQRFTLSELGPVEDNDFLDPKSFMIRVFSRRDATHRASPAWGEGAVLVFVHGKTQPPSVGPISEEGWLYPIPVGDSVTLLVGIHFLLRRLIERGVRDIAEWGECFISYDNDTIPGLAPGVLHVTAGTNKQEFSFAPYLRWDGCRMWVMLPLCDPSYWQPGVFDVTPEDDRITVEWRGSTGNRAGIDAWFDVIDEDLDPEFNWMRVWFDLTYNLKRTYTFEVDADGRLALVEDEAQRVHEVTHRILDWDSRLGREAAAECMAHNLPYVLDGLENAFATALRYVGEVDLFRLNSLLFRSEDALQLRAGHLPTDLAVFGTLAPRETAFAIEPQEVLVVAGGQAQLEGPAGAVWSVESIEGYDDGTGTISAGGLFTAPPADAIARHYTMVLVRATLGGHASTALVRVLKREIVCNPNVVVVGMGGQKVKFSAGALDGAALQWAVKSGSGGRLEAIPPDNLVPYEPGDHFYISGPQLQIPEDPAPADFIAIDEVVVTHPRTQVAQTSYVVTLLIPTMGHVRPAPESMTPEQVQLQFMGGGEDPMEGVEWSIVLGSGAISAAGLYTADPDAPLKFAVIQAYKSYPFPGVPVFSSYILLTVPLVDLEQLKVDPVPES